MRITSRRGFALLAALLATLLVAVLALTAASLALLARRSSASSIALTRADALAESEPNSWIGAVPATPGGTLTVPGASAVPGWSTQWIVTRLGGDLLLVRTEVSRRGSAGDELAHAALFRLYLAPDSSPPTPLSGGWLGAP